MSFIPEQPDELEEMDEDDEPSIGWTLIGVAMTFVLFAVLCRMADIDRAAYVLFWIGIPVAAVGFAWELVTRPRQFLPTPWD